MPEPIKETITFDDFAKLDIRVGTVTRAEEVSNSRKLIKLQVDLGGESRQIIAGIVKEYRPESLINRQVMIVANLEPKELGGLMSEGMILAANSPDGKPVLYLLDAKVEAGSKVS